MKDPGMLCNIRYLSVQNTSQTQSRKILFIHNIHLDNSIILKFCTEHGSNTAVLCAKFQNDWMIETDGMDERDFTRFEFKMSFGWISYIAQHPRVSKAMV